MGSFFFSSGIGNDKIIKESTMNADPLVGFISLSQSYFAYGPLGGIAISPIF